MAIQKVNEHLMPRGPIENMKRYGNDVVKPEETETKKNGQLQNFKDENKGFKIDTRA
jgi:hypothetical protein